jgi:predicted lipid-binding transport protein (Tim44 family)
MKRFLTVVFAAFVATVGAAVGDAEAKRLGGGKSSGMQRDQIMNRQATPPAQLPGAPAVAPARPGATPAGPAPAPRTGMSRFLGPIAGLAAGLGLAALFSHLGLGEEMASFFMLLLLIVGAVLLYRMLRRSKMQPGQPLQYAGGVGREPGSGYTPPPGFPAGGGAGAAAAAAGTAIPFGFDVEAFLRQAKLNFLRLQAAHDAGNIEDIREFTTPEMFANIRLDLQDRGGGVQQTDVVTLDADLLDVSEEGRQYLASVRFHGTIRETDGAAPEAFDEVWHLAKEVDGSTGWLVAGIQQRS